MELKQNEDLNINTNNDNKTQQNIRQKKKIKVNKRTKKVLLIIILIAIIIVTSILLYKFLSKDKLSYYENKMIEYGLAEKYNNNVPNDEENVTKSEAVKMVVESILQGNDVSIFADVYTQDRYNNFIWVYYAKITGIIDNNFITDENESENIEYIQAIKMLDNIISKNYVSSDNIEKVVENEKIKLKKSNQYTQEEIDMISKFISYGIIPNNYKYSKDQILTKKLLNEMLVNFIEQFNLVNI